MPDKPSPSQIAQMQLTAELAAIYRHSTTASPPLQRGKAMAEQTMATMADKEKDRLEELQRLQRQSQAAANSVAVGPSRATADQRRRALAQLLAARMQREDDKHGSWTTLAKRLIEQIGAMEADSADAQQRAKQAAATVDPTGWGSELALLGKEQRVETAERFLHALERAASAHSVMEGEARQQKRDEEKRKQAEPEQQALAEKQTSVSQTQGGDDDQ